MIKCDTCKKAIAENEAQPLHTPFGQEKSVCIKCYIKYVRGKV